MLQVTLPSRINDLKWAAGPDGVVNDKVWRAGGTSPRRAVCSALFCCACKQLLAERRIPAATPLLTAVHLCADTRY